MMRRNINDADRLFSHVGLVVYHLWRIKFWWSRKAGDVRGPTAEIWPSGDIFLFLKNINKKRFKIENVLILYPVCKRHGRGNSLMSLSLIASYRYYDQAMSSASLKHTAYYVIILEFVHKRKSCRIDFSLLWVTLVQ